MHSNKKLFTNTIWLLAQSILTMMISLVIGSISARYLGPKNYGTLSYVMSLVALIAPICTLGLQTIIVNEVVKRPEHEGVILGTSCFLRVGMAIVAMVTINIVITFLEPGNRLLQQMTLLQSINLLMLAYEVFSYWFQAKMLAKYMMFATVISSIAVALWRIVLLVQKVSPLWFALSTTLQSAVILGMVLLYFHKLFEGKLRVSLQEAKHLLSRSYHLILYSLGIIIYGQIDRIMLAKMLGKTYVGYYTAAYTVATLWYFIPTALLNSYRPHIYGAPDNASYDKRTKELTLIIILLGLISGIGFTVLGKPILLLLFGKAFLPGFSSLLILGWVGLFAQLIVSQSIWLLGKEYQRFMTVFTLLGALVNIVINMVLIPKIGIIGASLGTLIAQIFVQMIAPLFFKPTRKSVALTLTSYTEFGEIAQRVKSFAVSIWKKIRNALGKAS